MYQSPEQFSPAACMEALQLAGKIIMENGGETYRAEETICRMGGGFGLEEVDSFAVPSGLFISYRGPDGLPVTSVKRVRREGRNLSRVDEVNRVSRLVSSGKVTVIRRFSAFGKSRACRGISPVSGACLLPSCARQALRGFSAETSWPSAPRVWLRL